jgi:hypothetical protein
MFEYLSFFFLVVFNDYFTYLILDAQYLYVGKKQTKKRFQNFNDRSNFIFIEKKLN